MQLNVKIIADPSLIISCTDLHNRTLHKQSGMESSDWEDVFVGKLMQLFNVTLSMGPVSRLSIESKPL